MGKFLNYWKNTNTQIHEMIKVKMQKNKKLIVLTIIRSGSQYLHPPVRSSQNSETAFYYLNFAIVVGYQM